MEMAFRGFFLKLTVLDDSSVCLLSYLLSTFIVPYILLLLEYACEEEILLLLCYILKYSKPLIGGKYRGWSAHTFSTCSIMPSGPQSSLYVIVRVAVVRTGAVLWLVVIADTSKCAKKALRSISSSSFVHPTVPPGEGVSKMEAWSNFLKASKELMPLNMTKCQTSVMDHC